MSKEMKLLQIREDETNVTYKFLVSTDIYELAHKDYLYAKHFLQTQIHKHPQLFSKNDQLLETSSVNILNASDTAEKEIKRQKVNCVSTDIAIATRRNYLENEELEDIEEDVDDVQPLSSNVRHKWTCNETKLLLSIYAELHEQLKDGKITNNQAYKKLSRKMREKGYQFSLSQCNAKIENLKKLYKKCVDHNRQAGNEPKSMEHFEILNEIFGRMPWVQPLSTAGSSVPLGQDINENHLPNLGSKRYCKYNKADFLKNLIELKKRKLEIDENYKKEKLEILRDIKNKL